MRDNKTDDISQETSRLAKISSDCLANYISILPVIWASQTFSVPMVVAAQRKYVNPTKPYPQIFSGLYNSGQLYSQLLQNTQRRSLCMIGVSTAAAISGTDNSTSERKAICTALFDSLVSIWKNEPFEKATQSGRANVHPRINMHLTSSFILLRNMTFSSSIFCRDYIAGTEQDYQNSNIENWVKSNAIRASIIALSTPIDGAITHAASGKSIVDIGKIMFENPRTIFAGGVARFGFSLLASATIEAGLKTSDNVTKPFTQSLISR
jgi:hypothetical protein